MMDDQTKAIIERYLEAYNAFDTERMASLLHGDIVFRNFNNGVLTTETKGIQAFRELADKSAALFSSRCQKAVNYRDSSGSVEVEIDYAAVLAVDLPNGLKAGEQLRLQGKSVFGISEGTIIRIEDYS